MSESFTVYRKKHGIIIDGPVPIDVMAALCTVYAKQGHTHMNAGISSALKVSFVFASPEKAKLWEAEIAERNSHLDALDKWLAGTDTGISARTMVFALTGRKEVMRDYNPSIPSDAGDFGRCRRLLEAVPEFRAHLAEIGPALGLHTHAGVQWQALALEWQDLEKLHDAALWKAIYSLLSKIRSVKP